MASVMRFDEWQDSNGNPVYDGSRGALPIGRNLLYNGAMQVAQRGTSETGITGSSYFTADRWITLLVTLGTFTQTIEDDGPTGSGFAKSLKMECTTADAAPASGDLLVLSQRLEGYDLQGLKKGSSSAESLTLSFWVKSNVTGTYIAELDDADNGRNISASYSIASSGTWEKKTITFSGDTTGVLDADNARSLDLNFWLGAGSNFISGSLQTSWGAEVAANRAVGQTNLASATSNYWQVTGVQLETGTVASPFEHKPYGVELAECQRYYQKFGNPGSFAELGRAQAVSASSVRFHLSAPVEMRTVPTSVESLNIRVVLYTGTGYGSTNSTVTLSTGTPSQHKVNVDATSGLTAGTIYEIRITSSTDGYLAFSAEL